MHLTFPVWPLVQDVHPLAAAAVVIAEDVACADVAPSIPAASATPVTLPTTDILRESICIRFHCGLYGVCHVLTRVMAGLASETAMR